MDKRPVPINRMVLKWARDEAGLSLEEAAARAGITPPRGKKGERQLTPAERLGTWESGEEVPSLAQIESIAAAYRRPLLTFFLPSPPRKTTSLADYRTVGSKPKLKDSPEFSAFKRRIEALQEELVDLAQLGGQQPLQFVGSIKNCTDAAQLVASIRSSLSFPFSEQQRLRDSDQLLRVLRERTQQIGIFVLFEGDLGSYHSKISPDEFRGIAFANNVAPLVVVNPNDAKSAQLFTLIHELAHIWAGSSGISNLDSFGTKASYSNNNNGELFCNLVAAEFLVPQTALLSEWNKNQCAEVRTNVEWLAKAFKVSREVIARRLFDNKLIDSVEYSELVSMYRSTWDRIKQVQKDSGSGPSRNKLDRFRLGDRLLVTVTAAAFEGKITLQSAARILRIPVSRFEKVMYA